LRFARVEPCKLGQSFSEWQCVQHARHALLKTS